MIVAVDTNVLFELLGADQNRRIATRDELDSLNEQDDLVISECVYAELAGRFQSKQHLEAFLNDAEIALAPSGAATLFRAGTTWLAYARRRPTGFECSVCGHRTTARCEDCEAVLTARQRVLPDFYIGAHALVQANRLLTRDQRYYRTYFPELEFV